MTDTEQNRYLLLQISDALFPIGSYAHSYGLETYVQSGQVKDIPTAEIYIRNALRWNICFTDLLAVKLAYEYTVRAEEEKIAELNQILSAVKAPSEIRQASFKLGARFIKTVEVFDITYKNRSFESYREKPGKKHYTAAYGIFCGACGMDYELMLTTFLYAQTSAMVTNCVKLVPLSQTTGQKLLYSCFPVYEEVTERLKNLTIADLGRSTPGFDISCMQHEGLYSRLYMS